MGHTVNVGFIFQVAGTLGGLVGIVALLAWLNTRRAQRLEATGKAGVEYDKFMQAAMKRANETNDGLCRDLTIERKARKNLITLVYDLVGAFRAKGASSEEAAPFLDRLDVIRADR